MKKIIKQTIIGALVLSSAGLLSSCAVDSAANGANYVEYEPTTGYTVGEGPYNISNGYSPEYWNPGYTGYVGYNTGYIGNAYYYGGHRGYYGGHTGYYGGHGGYARGGYAHGGHR